MADLQRADGVILGTGAGWGIGAATLLAASRGYVVGVKYLRDARSADAVVRRIEQGGGKAIAFQGKVSLAPRRNSR